MITLNGHALTEGRNPQHGTHWQDYRDQPVTFTEADVRDWGLFTTHAVKGVRIAALLLDGRRVAVARTKLAKGTPEHRLVERVYQGVQHPSRVGSYGVQNWHWLSINPGVGTLGRWSNGRLYLVGIDGVLQVVRKGRRWLVRNAVTEKVLVNDLTTAGDAEVQARKLAEALRNRRLNDVDRARAGLGKGQRLDVEALRDALLGPALAEPTPTEPQGSTDPEIVAQAEPQAPSGACECAALRQRVADLSSALAHAARSLEDAGKRTAGAVAWLHLCECKPKKTTITDLTPHNTGCPAWAPKES